MFINLYKILITILFPILRVTYIKKRQKIGKEPVARFNERLGNYTYLRPRGKLYWFHGASVGESISMLPLIDKLLKEDEDLNIMVTTGTLTSAEIMEKRLPKRAFHQFICFDTPRAANNLIAHFKPDAVLWFESELWPTLLSTVKKHHIPLILVNGRISDHSYPTWKKFKFIAKELLGCFSLCLGQSEQDRVRLQVLGAKKVDCVGNIKFSALSLPVDEQKRELIIKAVNNRPVFLISSTHANEEEQFASSLHFLKDKVKDVLIISVPRHPHRGEEIKAVFEKEHFSVALRSKNEELLATTDIYIADTIGEMGLWYGISAISFIGGSLINHGGQNFIEPARDHNAVIVGPYMQNFTEMFNRARNAHAVVQCASARDVIERVVDWFLDEGELEKYQNQAYCWAMDEAKVLDNISLALKKELN